MYFVFLKLYVHSYAYKGMCKYAYTCYKQSEFAYVPINLIYFLLHFKDKIMKNCSTSLKIGRNFFSCQNMATADPIVATGCKHRRGH